MVTAPAFKMDRTPEKSKRSSAPSPRLLSADAGQKVGQDFDVLRAERLSRGGHVAVDVGPLLRLEGPELGEQVLVLLPREPRDVLLAEELRAVALAAVEFLREARPGGRILRLALVLRRRRLLLGEM